jgi:hypothetical protein
VADLVKARIVITNYYAFKLRERMDLSKDELAISFRKIIKFAIF